MKLLSCKALCLIVLLLVAVTGCSRSQLAVTATEPQDIAVRTRDDRATGIIICDPIVADKAQHASVGATYAAAAAWLQFAVGGQEQLTGQPTWYTFRRVGIELKPSFLSATTKDVPAISSLFDVDRVAVGSLSVDGDTINLTYTVCNRDGKEVPNGQVSESFTRQTRAGAMESLAAKLCELLSIDKPHLPKFDLTDAMLQEIGYGRYKEWQQGMSDSLPKSGASSLLGAFMEIHMTDLAETNPTTRAQESLRSGYSFPLVAAEVANFSPSRLNVGEVESRLFSSPNNSLLHEARLMAAAHKGNKGVVAYEAGRLSKLRPHDSEAFLIIADGYSALAQAIRKSRITIDMTATEQKEVSALYDEWFRNSERATELAPQSASAWLEVACAGTFAGHKERAEAAFWKAFGISHYLPGERLYWWGLEMFQPKWGGDPSDLNKIATAISNDKSVPYWAQVDFADQLCGQDVKNARQIILKGYAAKAKYCVEQNKRDTTAVAYLADAYFRLGDYPETIRIISKMSDESIATLTMSLELSSAYYKVKDYKNAATISRKYLLKSGYDWGVLETLVRSECDGGNVAVALDLLSSYASVAGPYQTAAIRGDIFYKQKQYAQAIKEYIVGGMKPDKTWGNHECQFKVGQCQSILGNHKLAADNMKEALIRIPDWSDIEPSLLVRSLSATGKHMEALSYATYILSVTPDDKKTLRLMSSESTIVHKTNTKP
ncbi:MAG TPA: hypothetical protein VGK19_08220 [Capsulimonadaceae bacterium]|jgi:tetratricopeptide (TPR) repeat protein